LALPRFPLFRPDLENPTLEDCKPAFASMMPMGEPWVEPDLYAGKPSLPTAQSAGCPVRARPGPGRRQAARRRRDR
jgi:hypothetical protein